MTETPDERRERIDEARREQAELLRQIGHEHATLAIRPSAMQAWREFQEQLVEVDEPRDGSEPKRRNCRGREKEFSDYGPFDVPSPGRAKMMCAGCAVTKCPIYAKIANPGWGVYGGDVYGRRLAEIERREAIRDQQAKAKEQKEEA